MTTNEKTKNAAGTTTDAAGTTTDAAGTKHTPGPWEYDRERCAIVAPQVPAYESFPGDCVPPIAVIDLIGAMGGLDTQADIALIASAPDLLDALVHCLGYEAILSKKCVDKARAAILKAKGGTR